MCWLVKLLRRPTRACASPVGLSTSGRRGGPESQTERLLPRLVGRDLAIDLLGVVAALGQRLRAALEAGIDLLDLGARILQRVDPVPFRRKPAASQVLRGGADRSREASAHRQAPRCPSSAPRPAGTAARR